MQWWQSGLAVWYRCRTIQPAGYVPVQTFQGCHYIRRDSYPAFLTTRCFSQISHDFLLAASRNHFYQPAGGISEQCWYFGWLQLGFTLTTIWYSVDVSVHDTNKRCSHYASCLSWQQLELAALWNSQVATNIHRRASTLHWKTYISPVSRSEVWRNDWIVVISPVTTSTGLWFHNRDMCVWEHLLPKLGGERFTLLMRYSLISLYHMWLVHSGKNCVSHATV